nr:immunoglobulin heavy chain junction region [Macaca mulatta]
CVRDGCGSGLDSW